MILFLLAYAGGALTILSPCILPVLPFVFARADRPFLRSGLPLLLGLASSFALVASLATVAGGWAVEANRYGRGAALALLALFGLSLLFPTLADRAMQPLVRAGARLSASADRDPRAEQHPVLASLLLGAATGLLWAPCAGPVLGLLLTGAALQGANAQTSLLLLSYAAGAATSLALALLVGGRMFAAMKRSLGAGEWLRRGLGAAVLVGVGAIALGLDTGLLTRLSLASTASLEQGLIERLHPQAAAPAQPLRGSGALPVEGQLQSLSGAVAWLNSPPLSAESLRGKVVLIDFWTYSCINCLRTLPYVRAWAEKYRDQGLVVIGVHTPEFAFEKRIDNVRQAVADFQIDYPVAIDNNYAIWRAYDNRYWPAHYFIDAQGRIRHHHFGEGEYARSEQVIRQLLAEAGQTALPAAPARIEASGIQAAPAVAELQSPETYLGHARARNFVSPQGLVHEQPTDYSAGLPGLNQWGLAGRWVIGGEQAALAAAGGRIVYRFRARDLHLVLGPGPGGEPVRFRVRLDGAAPGADHGQDIDAEGQGLVRAQRLYQLIRQTGAVGEHSFEIEFLDPGVQAYAFTFG
ncbi:MAG: cytochrome c biogenesis protein CcdA [Stagnimonas sp.]|nr:cytochrome c biogenesis protein CcdA [Stagnimonas sp.]